MVSPLDVRGTEFRGFYNVSRLDMAPFQSGSFSSFTSARRMRIPQSSLDRFPRSPLTTKGGLYVESNVDQVIADVHVTTQQVPQILAYYSKRAADTIKKSVMQFYQLATITSAPNTLATMLAKDGNVMRLTESGRLSMAVKNTTVEVNMGPGGQQSAVNVAPMAPFGFAQHSNRMLSSKVSHLAGGFNMNMGVISGSVNFDFPTAGHTGTLPGPIYGTFLRNVHRRRENPDAIYPIFHEFGTSGSPRMFNFGVPALGKHKGYPRRQWIIPGIEQGARGAAIMMQAAWSMLYQAYYRAGRVRMPGSGNMFLRDWNPRAADVSYMIAPPSQHYSTFGMASDMRGVVTGAFDRLNATAWLSKYVRGMAGVSKRVHMRGIRGSFHGGAAI